MKLYATVTSERAQEHQGGNDYIIAIITAEIGNERQEIASMSLTTTKEFYNFQYTLPDGKKGILKISKGEKQKDECTITTKCQFCTKYPCSEHDGSKYE